MKLCRSGAAATFALLVAWTVPSLAQQEPAAPPPAKSAPLDVGGNPPTDYPHGGPSSKAMQSSSAAKSSKARTMSKSSKMKSRYR